MLAAIPRDGHQIPRTSPNALANSQAARSGKYFNGTPMTSWIILKYAGRGVASEAGKRHHRREKKCNYQVRGINGPAPLIAEYDRFSATTG